MYDADREVRYWCNRVDAELGDDGPEPTYLDREATTGRGIDNEVICGRSSTPSVAASSSKRSTASRTSCTSTTSARATCAPTSSAAPTHSSRWPPGNGRARRCNATAAVDLGRDG